MVERFYMFQKPGSFIHFVILFLIVALAPCLGQEESGDVRVLYYPNTPGSPQGLKVEYTMPGKMEVGKEVTGKIKVTNLTGEPIRDVAIQVQTGNFKLISAEPAAMGEEKKISWRIPELDANGEELLIYRGVFEEEGAYNTELIVECVQLINRRLTREFQVLDGSYLDLRLVAPTRTWINTKFPVTVKVRNFSRQPLNDITIDFGYDDGMKQAGTPAPLGQTLSTLAGGETKELVYQMTSAKEGKYILQAVSRSRESKPVSSSQQVAVGTSGLMVEGKNAFRGVAGVETALGFVARNTSKVPAKFVKVYATLPETYTFARSNPPTVLETRNLTWNIGDLAPGESKHFGLWGVPEKDGDLEVKLRAVSLQGSETTLNLGIQATQEPILESFLESGEKAYRVGQAIPLKLTLTNKGTAEDKDIRVRCKLPAGVEVAGGAEEGAGPVVDQGMLRWDTKAQLAPGETQTFELLVKASQAGPIPVIFDISAASLLESAELSRTLTVE
jgi:hypothetical protein